MKLISLIESIIDELSGSKPKYTDKDKEKIVDKAKKFVLAKNIKNPRQLHLKNNNLYYVLRAQNLIDQVFPERKKYHPDGYWNFDTVTKEAEKYSSRSEFEKKNQVAYNKAREMGILKDLFPQIKERLGKYTLSQAKELAKDWKGTYSSFLSKYPSAVKVLSDEGILNKYLPKGKRGKKVDMYGQMSNEELKAILDDKIKSDKVNQISFYLRRELEKRGIDIPESKVPKKKLEEYLELSDDMLIKMAQPYGSLTNMNIKNPSLRQALRIRNLSDNLFPDTRKQSVYKNHSDSELIDLAMKYGSKTKIRDNDLYLYRELRKRGLNKNIFKHPPDYEDLLRKEKEREDLWQKTRYDDLMFTPVTEQINRIKRLLK